MISLYNKISWYNVYITSIYMSTTSSIVDPDAWVSAERSNVAAYAAIDTQAQFDLSNVIQVYEQQLQKELDDENEFAKNILELDSVLNPDAINKTVTDLLNTSTSIDTVFKTLQEAILTNNKSAATLASKLEDLKPKIQQISEKRMLIKENIAKYQEIISSFRSN